ncbi:protein phosphatase 2C domain-containing protein [Streptomyces sp. RKAG293]|uniref:protein phosphatase 2C domain-containing protein n=1 Tax=Streptomyces sp. RKAG293 TaxID=2893403 RepID=UPI0020341523|nr:protein phosphatase 2C domain-containing protein [Streptomyces sp. RKAG293]MCM2422620.1 protein phosphatase 2C domain-containing protein [Streptomyces sp. RKAG293]
MPGSEQQRRSRIVVAGAMVQGTAHLANATACQDAFRSFRVDARTVVLAVADGAGSRSRGALGAHLAVDLACDLLRSGIPAAEADGSSWTGWVSERARAVVDAWNEAVDALGAPLLTDCQEGPEAARSPVAHRSARDQCASTVAAALLRPPWVAFLSLGDSFGVVLTRDQLDPRAVERCHLVLPPQASPDRSTVFLSSPTARARVRSFALRDDELSGVVLATDGCLPLALDHPSVRGLPPGAGPLPAPGFYHSLSTMLRANGGHGEPLRALLSGPGAARSGDDLTVLGAVLTAEPAEPLR